MDESLIGHSNILLDQKDEKLIHHLQAKHTNAAGVSEKMNTDICRGKQSA